MIEYTVSVTARPEKGIVVVGTAHVSKKSINEVNETIEREHPDIVAIELCQGRYEALVGKQEAKEIPVRELLSADKFHHFLIHWLLSYVQKKIGADMGVKPGAEMLAAIEKSKQIGARIALVDRDIQITLQRLWSGMTLFEKAKITFAIAAAGLGFGGTKEIDINTVTDADVVTQLVEELRKYAPSAAKVLIDERDAYIARNLLDISHDGHVVAVVGAGHRAGIQKYLEHPETLPAFSSLTTLPKKRFSILKAATILIIVTAIFMLAAMILYGQISLATMLTAIAYLFITQGILSAAGVIIARGHPLSVLTALSLAWFGFIHPFLAVGWLAGLVEAYFRPPTHDDFTRLTEASNLKELMNNKLFRIILVAALANIGSMVGTFVAIPLMVHYLGIPDPLGIIKIALENVLKLV
ncbi:MAG: TraB family protein [Methanosarcinales archaeon]|uniref:TraB family protein n=1 Tax=Candidatus Ethanoperedens thermophilum TaxID=2766897 RepID=A0A848D8U2_9EURY|nr:TraB family protein [Candidatus Ethanoperedens thermophilum]